MASTLTTPQAVDAGLPDQPNWVTNSELLWVRRRLLFRLTAISLVLATVIAFVIPKHYESTARLMPPDQSSSGAALLSMLAGRSLSGLGGLSTLAGSLLGGRTSSALYIDLLHSRTISEHLIDHFDLQRIYWKRYRIDTVKYLARHTTIVDDKKSGVISVTYSDTNAERARAITQAYVEELNSIVLRSNVSSARREREFIEKRLVEVQVELQDAQKALSEFSSRNATLDIKEQTHAMVDAAGKLEGELIVARSEMGSLTQIYGEENVRVRAGRARIASLQAELSRLGGSSTAAPNDDDNISPGAKDRIYPSLRQIPRLAVPYANLYRTVKIQETVYELLSQQYEMARLAEAKDTPVVSVIDPPLVAEKKSFPPRLLLILLLTVLSFMGGSAYVLFDHRISQIPHTDRRKLLAQQIVASIKKHSSQWTRNHGGLR